MGDIINLLPDALANQIAAGEVIQRPASVVKELMENALDAGSDHIKLIIKDSGKTLIQVIDNGSGMSDMDSRLCFERHATSKINSSDDLFQINSFGFRGEALASIAAVAHVELKTRLKGQEFGTSILIEGSKIKKQEACQTAVGSSFAVRNLFFNVPARRKFLKSDPVELKHILEEFARLALPNPQVFFSVYHNDNELYHFSATNLRQRLANYFGKNTNEKIVPVDEETDFIRISGFIGRPELYKKTRGGQYIFVNRRYIKSNYLSHAIKMAFENLIPKEHFPFYILLLEIDPAMIDVNIHPTKQEIKFENERLIYNLIRVAVKHALGKYSIAPTIDFESVNYQVTSREDRDFQGQQHKGYNPQWAHQQEKDGWTKFYREMQEVTQNNDLEPAPIILQSNWDRSSTKKEDLGFEPSQVCFQVHNGYIISPIKSGLIVIDQQHAHERILYENYLGSLQERKVVSQKSFFPETVQLSAEKAQILEGLLDELVFLGFRIEKIGARSFIIQSVPADGLEVEPATFIDSFLDSYTNNQDLETGLKENVAAAMAKQAGIKRGQSLQLEEMQALIDQLFACQMPYTTTSGHKCFFTLGLDELYNRFKSK